MGMTLPQPVQQFFSIGEVCALTDLKPHVLRYWESQFRFLNPAKNRSGNRVYKAREVELIMLVKHLLYTEKFTIDGARQRLDHYRRTGEIKAAAKDAIRFEMVNDVRRSLNEVVQLLDCSRALEAAPPPPPTLTAETTGVRPAELRSPAPTRNQPEESRAPRGNNSHGEEQLSLT
jgi:DNA-binding transcriptional MerR regulator